MSNYRRRRTIGIALVLMPLLIASMGMMWGNSYMLDAISSSVDDLDESRNWQAIQSAFRHEAERISSLLSDNAKWDDAVDNSYGEIDEAWLLNTWGYSTADKNYDAAFVIDAKGHALVSFQNGIKTQEQPAAFYGISFSRMLKDLLRDTTKFSIEQSIINSKNGVAAIAVAPIFPHSAERKPPISDVRFLIFSRTIDDAMVKALGDQYVIDGLSYGKTSSSHKYVLADRWGEVISEMKWKPKNLGNSARQAYFWSSLVAVGLLLAAMIPVALALARTLLKLEINEHNQWKIARKDALSDLPNRLSLMEVVQGYLKSKPDEDFALMLVDLDGFKMVNDIFDHTTGDKLIRAVAAGLHCIVDSNSQLARIGGDEFAIAVFGEKAQQRAETMAENTVKFVSEPFNLEGRFAAIGASIGIATVNGESIDALELLRRADIAMYKAKDRGGNCHRLYEEKLDSKNSEDVVIADELRKLLKNGEFDIHYQPLVDAGSNDTFGLEALARWPHNAPIRYSPDRFIPVAEQYGMIDELGLLLTQKAFKDAANWPQVRLSLNISPLQLNNRDLVSDIVAAARSNGFPLERLEVEFTEAVLIKNSRRVRQVIREFKQLGVSVALDDFGSGYASVGYLRKFNFDTIKLDRSLTSLATKSVEALMVVQGAVLIAKGLSAKVVAEGVETEEEAKMMRLAGCQILQGYYFSKPQSASAITTLLNEGLANKALMSA